VPRYLAIAYLKDVEVMRAFILSTFYKETPAGNAEFTFRDIPQCLHAGIEAVDIIYIAGFGQQVDNRLGTEARYGSTADVVYGYQFITQRHSQNTCFVFEHLWPSGVICNNLYPAHNRHSNMPLRSLSTLPKVDVALKLKNKLFRRYVSQLVHIQVSLAGV
jgi:hypothetical protein